MSNLNIFIFGHIPQLIYLLRNAYNVYIWVLEWLSGHFWVKFWVSNYIWALFMLYKSFTTKILDCRSGLFCCLMWFQEQTNLDIEERALCLVHREWVGSLSSMPSKVVSELWLEVSSPFYTREICFFCSMMTPVFYFWSSRLQASIFWLKKELKFRFPNSSKS